MYRFSRAIYRELSDAIIEDPHNAGARPCDVGSRAPDLGARAHNVGSRGHNGGPRVNHERVLRACEAAVERLATDRHYFAHPARTLFNDIRAYFPMSQQVRVLRVIQRYLALADEFVKRLPQSGVDAYGNPLHCRASTRKGTPCQRMPLAHNGYCPSHQHLAQTEERAALAA